MCVKSPTARFYIFCKMSSLRLIVFVLFCRILYVKLKYLQNTGTCSVIVAQDIVSWSGSTAQRVLVVKTFYENGECVTQSVQKNSAAFLAEMKLDANLL